MDGAAFATWRVGIGFLNSAQRSLAFQDLALAEANDAVEYRDDHAGGPARIGPGGRGRSHARNCRAGRGRSESGAGPAFEGRRRSNRQLWLPSLWRVGSRSLGPGERQASVSLQGVPEDIRSVDGNAVGWITLQGPLDGSSASLDERRIRRKGG
jgi:hypothetical protein